LIFTRANAYIGKKVAIIVLCLFQVCGPLTLTNAIVTSFNGSILTATCYDGYLPGTLTLECSDDGTWQGESICKLPYGIATFSLHVYIKYRYIVGSQGVIINMKYENV
jgi:hypothetical protein